MVTLIAIIAGVDVRFAMWVRVAPLSAGEARPFHWTLSQPYRYFNFNIKMSLSLRFLWLKLLILVETP